LRAGVRGATREPGAIFSERWSEESVPCRTMRETQPMIEGLSVPGVRVLLVAGACAMALVGARERAAPLRQADHGRPSESRVATSAHPGTAEADSLRRLAIWQRFSALDDSTRPRDAGADVPRLLFEAGRLAARELAFVLDAHPDSTFVRRFPDSFFCNEIAG